MGSSRQKTYKIFFTILSLFVVVYGFIKVFPLLRGSQVFVEGLKNGENHGPIAYISGKTISTTQLKINDNEIMLDEKGNFRDTLLLSPGYNIISIKTKDRFNREKIKEYKITSSGFEFPEEIKVATEEISEEESSASILGASAEIETEEKVATEIDAEIEYIELQGEEDL